MNKLRSSRVDNPERKKERKKEAGRENVNVVEVNSQLIGADWENKLKKKLLGSNWKETGNSG